MRAGASCAPFESHERTVQLGDVAARAFDAEVWRRARANAQRPPPLPLSAAAADAWRAAVGVHRFFATRSSGVHSPPFPALSLLLAPRALGARCVAKLLAVVLLDVTVPPDAQPAHASTWVGTGGGWQPEGAAHARHATRSHERRASRVGPRCARTGSSWRPPAARAARRAQRRSPRCAPPAAAPRARGPGAIVRQAGRGKEGRAGEGREGA